MYSDHVSVIGNGCVVNPKVVLEEIDMFEADGITTKNLKISGNAHVIMPYHIDLDGAFEQKLGKKNIGTTKRGIGPCYQDKMARIGLRMQDMLDEALFRDKLETALARVNPELELIYNLPTYTVDQICDEYLPMAERLRPYITETSLLLNNMIDEARTCCLRAPRRRCSTSITALSVRDVFQLHRRRRHHRLRRGHEER